VDGIAELNAIRYRSYYFDTETGLYYVKKRYYDSQTGRWISPDDVVILNLTMHQVNGLNLYMFCGNNPVNNIDDNGMFFKKIGNWFNNNIIQPINNHIVQPVVGVVNTVFIQPIASISYLGLTLTKGICSAFFSGIETIFNWSAYVFTGNSHFFDTPFSNHLREHSWNDIINAANNIGPAFANSWHWLHGNADVISTGLEIAMPFTVVYPKAFAAVAILWIIFTLISLI
jgi:RHS repeat-associated protein